jgi:two-component system, NtrC family, sensor kinase
VRHTVLIVDDSLTVRMDLAEAFEAQGYEARLAATAAEARAALDERLPELVILDLILPDGDGVTLLQELRALPGGEATAVLMLSTESEVRDRIRGLATGANDYVGKPYDPGYVLSRARELVKGQVGVGERRPTILVVDDSATFRGALEDALTQAGYDVVAAASGEEGLRLAVLHSPDAALIDGQLPGIDGPTVIRRLRLDELLRGTPCVLMTAEGRRGAELQAMEAGADAFVTKDEDVPVILARLAAILRGASGARDRDAVASSMGGKRILAVDDSLTHLEALGDALRGEGYDVALATSGEMALDLLAVQHVDCILLDLRMPGIGGEETCRRIKSAPLLRDIPLLIVTGVEDRQAMLQALAAGADDYIAKSADFDVLKARVRAQLRRRQFEEQTRRIRDKLLERELEAANERAARELAETRAALVDELERKNKDLEAFSYSVSHDLRAPLRGILGFSEMLVDSGLDEHTRMPITRIRAAATRMNDLIDALLELSVVARGELARTSVDLTEMAESVAADLTRTAPARKVEWSIAPGLLAQADASLIRAVLENLMNNAWKYSAKVALTRIEVGVTERQGEPTFFVRDNGAGFPSRQANRLFRPFQRLHADDEFAGIGIGLATVQRIIERHGGRVAAESAVGEGATFYFTLPAPKGFRA